MYLALQADDARVGGNSGGLQEWGGAKDRPEYGDNFREFYPDPVSSKTGRTASAASWAGSKLEC